jgi:hypothetical protein
MSIPTEPGIYRDVDNGEYDQIEAVRRTFAWKVFKESPHHAKRSELVDTRTKALDFGVMAHLAMLQPEEFPRAYAVMPPFELDPGNLTKANEVPKSPKATGYYRAKAAEFESMCKRDGIEIIPQSDYDMAYRIGCNVRAHPDMARFFQRGSRNEAVSVWRDQATGILCKARYDCLVEGDLPTAVDLKTAASGHPFDFMRAVRNNGYYFQAAWYLAGLRAHSYVNPNFLFVVGEKKDDCVVTVYELERETLMLGAKHCRAALDTICACEQSGEWPGYGKGIVPLQLSENELKELDDA